MNARALRDRSLPARGRRAIRKLVEPLAEIHAVRERVQALRERVRWRTLLCAAPILDAVLPCRARRCMGKSCSRAIRSIRRAKIRSGVLQTVKATVKWNFNSEKPSIHAGFQGLWAQTIGDYRHLSPSSPRRGDRGGDDFRELIGIRPAIPVVMPLLSMLLQEASLMRRAAQALIFPPKRVSPRARLLSVCVNGFPKHLYRSARPIVDHHAAGAA